MMVISCIFIIFILLIFTIVIFFGKTNKKIKESFTTPTAVNFPSANNLDGKPFFVGNNKNSLPPEEPIVESSGKYEFKKMKLLYDGVWGEKCYLDDKGFQKCNWSDKNVEYGKYGTDKFFDLPVINLKEGESILSPPDCPKPSYKKRNDYCYLQKPTFEDVFGFVPMSNRLEIDLPPPRLSIF